MTQSQIQKAVRSKILQWRANPIQFIEDTIDIRLNNHQRQVYSEIANNKFIAIKSGHGVGKTGFLALTILWFLTCYTNARVPCTAPTGDQLVRILWPEIYKWIQRSKLKDWYVWEKQKVYILGEENKCFAYYKTARTQEALAGIHEDNILYILEEASGIEDPIWEPVEGALTSHNARAIAAGNPTRPEGNFYRCFTEQAGLWKSFTFSSADSSQVAKEYIERQKKKYGEDSDVYRVRVLGEFPRQASDAFIPLYLCEQSRNLIDLPRPNKLKMGVDVARFGSNYTVWLIRDGGSILHVERKQTMDTMEVVGKSIDFIKNWNLDPQEVYIDSVGVGGGVVDRLHEQNIAVVDVNSGTEALQKEDYFNRRIEMWGNVKNDLETQSLCLNIENDIDLTDDLCGELASPKYKFTSKGQKQLEGKDEMMKRGVQSPDIADALALTYYANENNDFFVVSGGKISYGRGY